MEKNQFIYTVSYNVGTQETPELKEFKASFNINKVIRSLENEKGELVVILDDFNERVSQVPDINLKTNKVKGVKNVRDTVQSEITLNTADKKRFFILTNIEV